MAEKTDMSRVGIFKEMGYISVHDPYVPSSKFNFNQAAYKGKQMLPGNTKDKVTGLQDGYFSKQFVRVFEKEGYSDPIGNRRRQRMHDAKKNIVNKPFITFQGEKKPEGLGSYFGTFAGKIDYFSPKKKEGKPYEPEKPNVKTNPPKKGTGYGYANVALDKYPEYKSDKYDAVNSLSREKYESHKKAMVGPAFKSGKFHNVYFEKSPFLNEKDGPVNRESKRSKSESDLKPFKPSSPSKIMANPDGFFTKYPEKTADPYKLTPYFKPMQRVVNNTGKLFTPHEGPKSIRQPSVINYNVALKVNPKTYKQAQSYSTYHLNAVSAH